MYNVCIKITMKKILVRMNDTSNNYKSIYVT